MEQKEKVEVVAPRVAPSPKKQKQKHQVNEVGPVANCRVKEEEALEVVALVVDRAMELMADYRVGEEEEEVVIPVGVVRGDLEAGLATAYPQWDLT